MEIDNKKNTYRIWLSRMILTIIFTVAILLTLFVSWFDNPQSPVSKYHVIIIISLIYIVVNLYNYLKRPYFIYYSDKGEMIVMRYYPLSLFNSQKHSIEIPKKQLIRFELESFMFGSQQRIILYQNFRNKEAKYPPVSLSALEKEDRERLLQSLRKYVPS